MTKQRITSQNAAFAAAIADGFSRRVRAALSPADLAAVLDLNTRPEYATDCATWEYLNDPAALLTEAFVAVMGREPALGGAGADSMTWAAAWDLAVENNFSVVEQTS